MIEPIIYLLAIAAAQAGTAYCTNSWLILCHIAILTTIILRSALVTEHRHRRLILPLAMIPLLRIITMGLSLGNIPPVLLYHVSYAPVCVAAVVIVGIWGYSFDQVGINFRFFPTQLLVGCLGIALGIIEYFILIPEPMISRLTWQEVWLPGLVLLVSSGFMEEFVFRGVLQRIGTEAFQAWGIIYVSLLFAITHIGFVPEIDLIFVFMVALFFGWVVRETGSLVGVSLSRGISNITMYLVIPFLLV